MRRLIFSAILLPLLAPAASACLNDSTLRGSEREFRSQYQSPPPAPTAAPDTSSFDQRYLLRGLTGGALLAGAVALGLWRRSPAA